MKLFVRKVWNLERSDLARALWRIPFSKDSEIQSKLHQIVVIPPFWTWDSALLYGQNNGPSRYRVKLPELGSKINVTFLFVCSFNSGKEGFILDGVLRIHSMLVGKAIKAKRKFSPFSHHLYRQRWMLSAFFFKLIFTAYMVVGSRETQQGIWTCLEHA